ncbi:hypothetical protein FIBSPDRAFT_938564 [Athelia psychrophila]|uniref:ATP-grasp domain-containing protein n=1 Tax=Athelia psychrophila TaxID=1759441 RepID=A0A165Y7G2_9AGAM|nr:hypothetical protein FIBSPDRAFT_938564 [Fibularhizoctonia sp. CBS 109695]
MCIAADTISRDLAVAQGIPFARGTHVKSGADVCRARYQSDIRCMGESPWGQLFAEKALSGSGGSMSRKRGPLVGTRMQRATAVPECRRAPFTITRNLVEYLLAASVDMAPALRYPGVSTFEYLVNSRTGNWVFLEINPRVQVEHTATGETTNFEIAHIQLLHLRSSLAAPASLSHTLASRHTLHPTAKDPAKDCPRGARLPVDRWLCGVPFCIAGTSCDLLLATILVRRRDWGRRRSGDGPGARGGARGLRRGEVQYDVGGARAEGSDEDWDGGGVWGGDAAAYAALRETSVRNEGGVKMKRTGVVAHEEWEEAKCDTMRLKRELGRCGSDWDALKPRVRGLGVQRQQDADEVGATSMAGVRMVVNAASRDISPRPVPAWVQSCLRCKETHPAVRLHRTRHFPRTLLRHAVNHLLPLAFSPRQVRSSTSVSAGAFDLADFNDSMPVAALLVRKIVDLHPAVLAERDGGEGDTIGMLNVMKMESAVVSPCTYRMVRGGRALK